MVPGEVEVAYFSSKALANFAQRRDHYGWFRRAPQRACRSCRGAVRRRILRETRPARPHELGDLGVP